MLLGDPDTFFRDFRAERGQYVEGGFVLLLPLVVETFHWEFSTSFFLTYVLILHRQHISSDSRKVTNCAPWAEALDNAHDGWTVEPRS